MKKVLSFILVIMLIVSFIPTGLLQIHASAEDVVISVYDSQTLQTGLTTANADLVLWNDITYSGTAVISCHSIDLNGYKLVYSSQMTVGSSVTEFVIFDSLYSSDAQSNTGKLTASMGVSISNSEFIIENGVIDISNGISGTGYMVINDGNITVRGTVGANGKNGSTGADGRSGSSAKAGGDGGHGGDGEHGIEVSNMVVYGGNITVIGGSGGRGGNGGNGGIGKDGAEASTDRGGNGANGGNGGNAGLSGSGIVVTGKLIVYSGILTVTGGNGANGGNAGNGGRGGKGGTSWYYPSTSYYGNGGDGGNGGNGGNCSHGSEGIVAKSFSIYGGTITAKGGSGGGTVGLAGTAGSGGAGDYNGVDGTNGVAGTFYGDGGAGIAANCTVYDGTVKATGGKNAAGIGGSGYANKTNGYSVAISGGHVTAQAGTGAFDIGSGYDTKAYGTPGTLQVTGGVLEFATYGRATNATNPVFKNCTVMGKGAYQHEGTYNADGKFTITVEDVLVDPADCVGYDSVTVIASVRISRTSNITTPKLKGLISFKLDGEEFATSSVADAALNGDMLIATASTNWIAVEGAHQFSVEYIPGDNDKYASGGTYTKAIEIALHTHQWEDEYTVDAEPTCTTQGSKSIHCSLCDVQKDFAPIEMLEHHYVNNQCEHCKEFLPLVIFKDHDGTILNSEYYYLGDDVTAPDAPSREKDNAYTYRFIGWDKEVVPCAGDTVYTAVYESIPIEYTVIFKNYDGSELQRNTYHYGDAVLAPADVPQKPSDSRYEYTFAGWDSTICPCDGDKVYVAVFTSKYLGYTVTFKNWDGTVLSSKTYHYGDTVTIPANPTKASTNVYKYTFAGWDKAVTTVTKDAVYTATFTPSYINYTVTFKNWDGTVLSSRTYHYGDTVMIPANPTKASTNNYKYTFAGWDKAVTTVTGDAVYTATFTSSYIYYTVTFKNWDGTVLSSNAYRYGATVTAPANPVRGSDNTYYYAFAGWDKAVTTVTKDTVYTATFTPIYINYSVTFKNWDGTVLSSRTYHYGDTVMTPANPTKASNNTYRYTFAGWDKPVVNCTGNVTYTATYTSAFIDYTVKFVDWNGTVISAKTYHYGDIVTAPADPVRVEDDTYTYVFTGWDANVTGCYGNATYTAVYERKTVLRITAQPTNTQVDEGVTAVVTVGATGDDLAYQWYIKNAGGSKFSKSSITAATYTVAMSQKADGRQVYCVITDKYGNSLTSDKVTLSMNKTELKITQQPTDVTAKSGETAAVKVTATGDGLTYQWYIKNVGGSKFSKSSITNATYTVTMSDNANGRQVYCVVKDRYGNSVKSNTVTLTMLAELKITTQPVSVCVENGDKATVKVAAQGVGLTYDWFFMEKGGSEFKYTASFKTNTYSVEMTDARAGRQVLCVVYDAYGNSVQSDIVTLNQSVRITKQPTDVCVANGKTVTIKVTAKGDGLTYKWYYKDAGASDYKYTASFKGNTYTTTMTDARAGRRVLCKVYDKYGNMVKSESAVMEQPARIIKQPVNVTVAKGATAKVTVSAKGEGLTYSWFYLNKGGSEFVYTDSFTGNSYSVKMDSSRNGRQVCCIITDKFGNSVQSDIVTLKMK